MTERDEQSRAARRELERLREEGGLLSTLRLKTKAHSLRGHFLGEDADAGDRMEVWGTRIGRGLGAIAFFGLLVWLIVHLGH